MAWLLGLQLTVQIVAGPGNSIRHISGWTDPPGGRPRSGRWWKRSGLRNSIPRPRWLWRRWKGRSTSRAGRISGGPCTRHPQCAPTTARSSCARDCDVNPGPALKRLATCTDEDRLWQRLQHDRSEDALSATLLLENRQRQHIYLVERPGREHGRVAGDRLHHVGGGDRPSESSMPTRASCWATPIVPCRAWRKSSAHSGLAVIRAAIDGRGPGVGRCGRGDGRAGCKGRSSPPAPPALDVQHEVPQQSHDKQEAGDRLHAFDCQRAAQFLHGSVAEALSSCTNTTSPVSTVASVVSPPSPSSCRMLTGEHGGDPRTPAWPGRRRCPVGLRTPASLA